jgi:hypothetical protein
MEPNIIYEVIAYDNNNRFRIIGTYKGEDEQNYYFYNTWMRDPKTNNLGGTFNNPLPLQKSLVRGVQRFDDFDFGKMSILGGKKSRRRRRNKRKTKRRYRKYY